MNYNYKIYMANSVVRNSDCDTWSVMAYRLLCSLLATITCDTEEFEILQFSVKELLDIWNVPRGGRQTRSIQQAIEDLKNPFKVGEEEVQWLDDISSYEHGQLRLKIDDSMIPYIIGLTGNYTAFPLGFVSQFSSKYSYRLYALARSFCGTGIYTLTMPKAVDMFSGGIYTTANMLMKKVFDKAIEEINEYSDINLSITPIVPGKKVTAFCLSVHAKTSDDCAMIKWDWPDTDKSDPEGVNGIFAAVNNVNIVEYLNAFEEHLIVWDNVWHRYTHSSHDSVNFYCGNTRWHQFSTGLGGDIVEYLHIFKNITKIDALNEAMSHKNDLTKVKKAKGPKRKYNPPKSVPENISNVVDYLTSRNINEELIKTLIKSGKLYADSASNCCFLNYGKCCMIRSTVGNTKKKFTKSTGEYWFFERGDNTDTIYFFESPIDAMSFATFDPFAEGFFVALGGISNIVFDKAIIELNPGNEKAIKICTDWDDAGKKFSSKYKFEHIPRPAFAPNSKDWNEVLGEI